MYKHLPLEKPCPDRDRFINTIMGRVTGNKPPLVEYSIDEQVRKPITTGLLGREWVEWADDRATQKAYLDNFIEFWYRMGYDFVRYEQGLLFEGFRLYAPDTASGSDKQRGWADEHRGRITTWEEFENYRWPRLKDKDLFATEYLATHLPEGMGFMTSHSGGIFEFVTYLMSLEQLWMGVCEAPDLVKAIADKVGEVMVDYYRFVLDLPNLIAVFPGDDMGYLSGTLVRPDDLREYMLPWHKRFAAMAHAKGLPYFLHSCGNVEDIMEDLITDVRIDAKHSFEDVIMPVQDFHAKYGDRIGVLGGVDLNILAGEGPEAVRWHVRYLMDTCGERGRYAIGSGNSVPSYVPPENYLAMVDEANAPVPVKV